MAEDWLEVYESRADNNLRLNKITILSFLKFFCKINRDKLEIVVKATYGLQSRKFFEILNLTFWGRSLVTRRFGFHSNSWGADKIKGLTISIDFRNRNTELLLVFSIISSWFKWIPWNIQEDSRESKFWFISRNLACLLSAFAIKLLQNNRRKQLLSNSSTENIFFITTNN